jgi:hypothetical protein
MIELITAWILMTFFGFVPNQEPLNSGPPETGAKPGAFFRIPLNTFSPTSELFFSFLLLHTIYDIQHTALLGAVPKIAHLCYYPARFCSYPTRFWYYSNSFGSYPNRFWSYLERFSPSPVSFCPRFRGVLPPS